MLVAGTVICRANPITYQVNQTGIGFDKGSVTGTIETDGTTGVLAASNIINWNLQATCVGFVSCSADNFGLTGGATGNSAISMTGSGLTATATDLIFDFSSGAIFEIVDGSNAWALGLTSGGLVFEEILPTGTAGNASPETGTQVIGQVAAAPEPSTYVLALTGGLVLLLRKRFISASR
jgi:hypothetical protein